MRRVSAPRAGRRRVQPRRLRRVPRRRLRRGGISSRGGAASCHNLLNSIGNCILPAFRTLHNAPPMALQIYNTLTRSKETFPPRVPGKAGLYVCGPTVYDYVHIGNARTFTTFDMVARWLRTEGYDVTYVRNVTDIDDKIIERANASGTTFEALAKSMTAAFEEDCARLSLLPP